MYRMEGGLRIGEMAPDFSLKDELGDTVRLSDYKGKVNVLLAFYRSDIDEYSTKWLSELSEDYLEVKGLDTEVLAISSVDQQTALNTCGRYSLPFKLLCDPDCHLTKAYMVYDNYSKTPTCAAFIVDRSGIIQYKYVSGAPPDLPSDTDIIIQLRKMERVPEG